MSNLDYCKPEVKRVVEAILDDPCVRFFAKDTIREGLERDALDVVYDLELALAALRAVKDDQLPNEGQFAAVVHDSLTESAL